MATGWRSRGYLPHRDECGLIQHIVFGLNDALPKHFDGDSDATARIRWFDQELDLGHGNCLLGKPENATIVEDCILRDHSARYALAAWCIMPNHVHVIAEQIAAETLASIVQTWKSVSAHAINKAEHRKGALWQREYFDRFMRDATQFDVAVKYVENNPVAARLVERAEDWRFSSAWSGRSYAGEGAGGPGG